MSDQRLDSQLLCSVCIANYNGLATLANCLDSILSQDCPGAVEVLVHDDASSDKSAAWVRQHYPDVVLIESQANVGFCVANNRMAAQARGRYLLLFNNDAQLHPGALQALYTHANNHNFDGILGLPQYQLPGGELFDRGSRFDPFLNVVPNHDSARRGASMVMGACLWLPKTLWDELGGFPEWFGSIAEDQYLCLAAWTTGRAIQVLDTPGFAHWMGQSFGGGKLAQQRLRTTLRRRALSERNRSYNLVLFYPLPLLLIMLPLHLAVLAVEGALLAILKRDQAIWRSVYGACFAALWRERRRLRAERRRWQQQRRISVWNFLRLFQLLPYKLQMLLRHGWPEVS